MSQRLTSAAERHSRANRRIHAKQDTVSRFSENLPTHKNIFPNTAGSGYVALAVASESGTKKIDLNTGKGTDREQNMLAFAIHALKLVKEVISGQSKI